MKLLLIAAYSQSIIKFRGELIDSMVYSGMDVHVACPDISSDSETVEILVGKGVSVHDIPLKRAGTNPINDLKTLYSLFTLMKFINPDVVLPYTIKPVIYGLLAASLVKVPKRFALITGLGYAFTGDDGGLRSLIRSVVRRLYRRALLSADAVFFQNPDDEALFLELGITQASARTLVVNGSGVNTTQYNVASLPDKPVFLLIARLLGDKGVREYAEAACRVKQQYPEAKFELVGWIDENPDSINQAELDTWINGGVIDFKGKLSDIRPAIAGCSVYVLPSYREGTPRTVLEAMAMGRAVITTDAPGCRETVELGKNGLLVAVKSVDELAAGMIKMIESPELVAQFGKNSRYIAEAKYDVKKVNEFMLQEMGLS